jgi:hypothetical protein
MVIFTIATKCLLVPQCRNVIHVMLSRAKHLACSGCYKVEILRLCLRMTLRHAVSRERKLIRLSEIKENS